MQCELCEQLATLTDGTIFVCKYCADTFNELEGKAIDWERISMAVPLENEVANLNHLGQS